MSDYLLTRKEQDLLKVIKHGLDQAVELNAERAGMRKKLNAHVEEAKVFLRSRGVDVEAELEKRAAMPKRQTVRAPIVRRSFEQLAVEANDAYPEEISFKDIFTQEEITANRDYIWQLNEAFDAVHRLDEVDILIPAVAGILGGVIDCAFGGFVCGEHNEAVPGPLSAWVREKFDKALPADKIKELEKFAKVPYDAAMSADNKGNPILEKDVDGLTPYFHHLVQLGHDPILGFIFGMMDLLRGTMTTLDFKGRFVIQTVDGFSENKAQSLFEAIIKQLLHLLSDANGSSQAKGKGAPGMGLPVPFMALFNVLQFGSIGEDDLTIAELVKGMYYEGYDFRHFCSMSIPTMIVEATVRLSYFAKRKSEGCTFKEALPVGLNHVKNPKLATMLYIAHTGFTAINVGKVAVTKDPMNINYVEWLTFAKLSVRQFKWVLLTKPALREKYVIDIVNGEWDVLSDSIADLWRKTVNA